ncbi:MAG: PAS domain S-box protein [Gracilimonas sp.]|uniref:PAS domain-containing sensor histidine kinase n=1 Tax=Gracilimonas TaxID=649462 RepID=UPI001B0B4DE0|nr:histidine kinase dimerization/phosphoacceptor domain -containing protein [Gracilimonas sp.]MBO6586510.1 PAS domain S-box protein [Gracilimonas sp.]MBO6615167.1 PAS domain S-box protein [Gracilimonas sp.]
MVSTSYSRQILDNIPNSVFVVNVHDTGLFSIKDVNKAQLAFINKERDEIVGKYTHEIFPAEVANHLKNVYQRCVNEGERISYEEKINLPDKGERYYLTTLTPLKDEDGAVTSLVGTSIDITEQKLTEQSLRKSEEQYRGFVQNSTEGIYLFEFRDPIDTTLPPLEQIPLFFKKGYMAACNEVMAEMYGYNDSNIIIGKNLEFFFGNEKSDHIIEYFKGIIEANYKIKDALSIELDKDGNPKYFLNSITGIIKDGYLTRVWGTQKDVTTEKAAEKQLQESLAEKNTLLSEIHHRVKNNLAVVSGMMQLQAYEAENDSLKEKLYDSVVRIKTMATVHELLYQSQSFSKLEFSDTLTRLVENISETLQTRTNVEVDIDCELIHLNINQAIPASLIVNEVLTNTYKHAFPNKEEGKINFTLSEKDKLIRIEITDNGIGFPSEKNTEQGSLGVHLIDVLSQQIEANYEYTNNKDGKGTYFSMSFKRTDSSEIADHQLS